MSKTPITTNYSINGLCINDVNFSGNFNKGGTEVPYIVIKRFVNSKKDSMVYISV